MARDIDRLLDYIRDLDYIPPVHRQVIISRIDAGAPTKEELDRAKAVVYPHDVDNDGPVVLH